MKPKSREDEAMDRQGRGKEEEEIEGSLFLALFSILRIIDFSGTISEEKLSPRMLPVYDVYIEVLRYYLNIIADSLWSTCAECY